MTIWATDRCSGCEWVEISTLAEMATGDRQYVQGRWCERHVPTSVLYGSARRRYIETGDEAALAEMLQHVEEAR